MRVGVVGPLGPDTLADNVLHGLRELGHDAVSLGPIGPDPKGKVLGRATQAFRGLSAEAEQWSQRALIRRSRGAHCEVIINLQASAMASTISTLRASGAKVCLWYPDHISNVGRLSMVAADYDALFLKDPLFVQRLRDVYGMPAHYLAEACNPTWHRPVGEFGSQPHIAVVGNIYPTRARLLVRLHESGIPLQLFGSGFPRWFDAGPLRALHTERAVMREEKSRVFREAAGVLNNLHPAEMTSVNCRLFEASAAGGAVICEDRSTLAELFTPGQEVLPFDTFDELLAHCHTVLGDRDLARRVGDAASSRAFRDHTYVVRLRQMLEILASD